MKNDERVRPDAEAGMARKASWTTLWLLIKKSKKWHIINPMKMKWRCYFFIITMRA